MLLMRGLTKASLALHEASPRHLQHMYTKYNLAHLMSQAQTINLHMLTANPVVPHMQALVHLYLVTIMLSGMNSGSESFV